MIRRLIILLLIVGCEEPTSTNICVQSSEYTSSDRCFEWTDSRNSCSINGGTFLTDSTCEDYCSDFLNNDTTGKGCLICNNSNPDCL